MSYSVHQQALIEKFSALRGWEDRYRHILRLGKQQPAMHDELKIDQVLLSGCESNVWFYATVSNGSLELNISSDAKIVKGLIAIIVEAYQDLPLAEAANFDCEEFFNQLGLLNHLSPSRGNGIRAIIGEIKGMALSHGG